MHYKRLLGKIAIFSRVSRSKKWIKWDQKDNASAFLWQNTQKYFSPSHLKIPKWETSVKKSCRSKLYIPDPY